MSMLDLFRFGGIPFLDSEDISKAEISAYTNQHITGLTEDEQAAQFATEIASTVTLFSALDLTITSETTKLGIQKARVAAKQVFRAALPNEISKVHGAVVMLFGQASPMMAQFFPEGREVFGECPDALLDNKLNALADAVGTYASANPGSFTVGMITLVQDLASNWGLAHGESTAAKSGHSTQQEAIRAAKKALGIQLQKNVLKIATVYIGVAAVGTEFTWKAEEKIHALCPQHLLEDHPAEEEESSSSLSSSSSSSSSSS